MPSLCLKLQKTLLCNPKFVVFITKAINISDTKYCTFHRSVIISSSNLSYKTIYIWWHRVANTPLQIIYPLWDNNNIYNETHHFWSSMEHLVGHAQWCHCQTLLEKEIPLCRLSEGTKQFRLSVLGDHCLVYRLETRLSPAFQFRQCLGLLSWPLTSKILIVLFVLLQYQQMLILSPQLQHKMPGLLLHKHFQ